MSSNRELFEEYFDSNFKKSNILTEKQYGKIADEFKKLYGEILVQDKGAAILDIGCGGGTLFVLSQKRRF